MKKYSQTMIVLIASLAIALISAAMTHTSKPAGNDQFTAASLILQTTPSPQPEDDQSEIGSTDGIVFMGLVITVIILVPVLMQRKSWVQKG